MSDQPQGPGWWQASDGRYYPPEAQPGVDPGTAYGYPHGPYAYGPVPPKQGTNGLAIASLVCSVLGFCLCPLAVAGVVLGHIALSQIGAPANQQGGRGLAIAGLAVGYSAILLNIGFWTLSAAL